MIIISLILILLSSYLLASVAVKQESKSILGIIYIVLIAFAQIVLGFEILSLLNAIKEQWFICYNAIFILISLRIYTQYGKVLYVPNLSEFRKKLLFVLKKDKLLAVLFLCFLIFLTVQLAFALFLPVNFGDSLSYYFPRAISWLQQGNLNHFSTPDSRELIMPINFDLLYLWVMMFTKKVAYMGIFSYIGYLITILALYNFVKELGFSLRKALWCVLVFSSFILVSIEMHTPVSDLTAGGLILTALYLYLIGCKYNNKCSFYFSATAYALSVGIKTTSIIALPALLIPYTAITYLYGKKNLKEKALTYIGFTTFNFVIFSLYNYVLNFMQFNNPFSNNEQFLLNSFRGGFSSWLCSIIKYFYMLFDISGTSNIFNFSRLIEQLQNASLALIGCDINDYTSKYFNTDFGYSNPATIDSCFLGAVGLFTFMPALIISFKSFFKNKLSKKRIVLCSLAIFYIFSVLIFARTMVYTGFNARYLLTFAVVSSPILAYTYVPKKCIYKYITVFLVVVYLLSLDKHIPQNINAVSTAEETQIYDCLIRKKPARIAIMIDQGNIPLTEIEKLSLSGIKIDKLIPETVEEQNLSDYDYIVVNKYDMTSTNIVRFKERINQTKYYYGNCSYWDVNAQQIYYDNGEKPAMVLCDIPFDYLNKFEFSELNEIYLKNYVILKRKQRR